MPFRHAARHASMDGLIEQSALSPPLFRQLLDQAQAQAEASAAAPPVRRDDRRRDLTPVVDLDRE